MEHQCQLNRRVCEIIALHFDASTGTPYWLDQVPKLGFDPLERIRGIDDLRLFGLFDDRVLQTRPVMDFVPRSIARYPDRFVIAQTGGTLGRPVWTAYTHEDFHAAFVEPFMVAARHVGFPTTGNWIYAGPTGPHVIGRAAEAIARSGGGLPPFTLDFDPRWVAKLVPGSFAAERYLGHLVDQALAIIETQQIEVIFTTPLLLRALSATMTPKQRAMIRGVHYGGMAIDAVELRQFQTELFPNAVHLSGYGNTLFGCCLELSTCAGRPLRYFPFGKRLLFGVLNSGDGKTGLPSWDCTSEFGRLVFSRLDQSCFLPNVVERDLVRLVGPPSDSPTGFALHGVESPTPFKQTVARPTAALY